MKTTELVTLLLKWALARLAAKVKQNPVELKDEAIKIVQRAIVMLADVRETLSKL